MFLSSIGGTLVGLALVLGATAGVSLRAGLFARWFRVATVVLAVLSVVGAFAIGYAASGIQATGGVAVLLDSIWILLVGLSLWRRPALAD